jgi:tetratricopeptide (TPR) repeat protein
LIFSRNAALDVLDKVLQISPHSLPTLLAKAQLLTIQGKFKDSLAISNSVITSGTSLLAGAYFNNSTVSYAMKNYEEALNWSVKALSMEPKAGRILCANGMALFALGKVNQALKVYLSLYSFIFSMFE